MAKAINKKLSALFIMIISIILTGCANIEFSRISYASGKVEDTFVVKLDKDKIIGLGINYSNLVAEIENDLNNTFLISAKAFKVIYLTQPGKTNEEREQIINNVQTSIKVENDTITASITFLTAAAFSEYTTWLQNINKTDDEQNEPETPDTETTDASNIQVVKNLYLTTYIQNGSSIFNNLLNSDNSKFYDKYYNTYGKPTDSKISDVNFYQVFGSPNIRMKSNADKTFVVNGIKVHQWKVNPLLEHHTIEYYTTTPNTTAWYITAIILSVGFVIVALCGTFLSEKIVLVNKK